MRLRASWAVRNVGRFCRDSASSVGVAVAVIAISQASAVSTASQGRITVRLGIARSEARCSTG